ncbi:GNAT family N-acetyltransferase [uncultured Hymenobacter sp.]|uniref:GNAT family N-acetyltransferase n=1 Tax=uncultured Hymenobacter sp. TaxID=170016 RepID=UPI0035CC2E3C
MPISWTCKPFADLTLTELYAVLRLRSEIFVVEQNCPYLDMDGLDEAAFHLLGRAETGELAAYTRLLPKGVSYPDYASIGRVVVARTQRGGGLGQALMRESIRRCERLFGRAPIKIGAQQYLERFYQEFGFAQCGAGYDEDGIPHLPMLRA